LDSPAKTALIGNADFNPQNLANTAWSFATLKHEAPSLLDAIAASAQVRIVEFKRQALSNTAWGFATLNHEAPALFDAIARAAPVRINEFNPQELFQSYCCICQDEPQVAGIVCCDCKSCTSSHSRVQLTRSCQHGMGFRITESPGTCTA
jgi:hypothetical protein